jgi:hypothetical protein
MHSRCTTPLIATCLVLASWHLQADDSDDIRKVSVQPAQQVSVPPECALKARLYTVTAALSETDKLASESLLYVMTTAETRMSIAYTLQPTLKRHKESNVVTEASLTGSFTDMKISLLDWTGAAYAEIKAFDSPLAAQASALAITQQAIQSQSSGQTDVNFYVKATNIKSFSGAIKIHRELRSVLGSTFFTQADGSLIYADSSSAAGSQAHALLLADLLTSIDIEATVSYDKENMLVTRVVTNIHCG